MFDENEYIKLINHLQNSVTTVYVIILILSVIIGIASGIATLIITIPVGMFLAFLVTFATKVKIQEMKWRVDMYHKMDRYKN